MNLIRTFILTFSAVMTFFAASGQRDTLSPCAVERGRMIFHDNIDKEQLNALKADGRADSLVRLSGDEAVNAAVTYTIVNQVNTLQNRIECNPAFTNNDKLKYLRTLRDMVSRTVQGWRDRSFRFVNTPPLIGAFTQMMEADKRGESIETLIRETNYEVGTVLVECFGFKSNAGYNMSRVILLEKYCWLNPEKAMSTLLKNPNLPFADSIIKVTAYRNPGQLYDFALAANTALGQRILRHPDPLAKTIAAIAQDKSKRGNLFMPFLDNLYKGKLRFDDIIKVVDDSMQYFKLLVKTEIDYAGQVARNEPAPMGMARMQEMMKGKALRVFVSEMNRLHDASDPVRFRVVDKFTPQEMYYLVVMGEDEMYTSTYRGVYRRIMERMTVPAGDSLLLSVYFDKFRKFIRMAANYNELSGFLKTMKKNTAEALMVAFSTGLDRSARLMDIEDAVDVADSYASIQDAPELKDIAALMLKTVGNNYLKSKEAGNRKGEAINRILELMFRSAKDSTINISRQLNIPPIFSIDYQKLLDDSARVVQQVFFYGDKDGVDSYASFMSMFKGNPDWKIDETSKFWVTIKATKGKPVWIFANRPLDNVKELDNEAQKKLATWLEEKNLHPSVLIHRGHSYHLDNSLEEFQRSGKLVILGSCGGYHNLDKVLELCTDAHIISTKQVGARAVNEPILRAINSVLRNGKNIEWIPLWNSISKTIPAGDRETFNNYIPPHKNLGAIFIKAYKIAMEL
jgi:uncharacterized protein YsxB (DUF464 family)